MALVNSKYSAYCFDLVSKDTLGLVPVKEESPLESCEDSRGLLSVWCVGMFILLLLGSGRFR